MERSWQDPDTRTFPSELHGEIATAPLARPVSANPSNSTNPSLATVSVLLAPNNTSPSNPSSLPSATTTSVALSPVPPPVAVSQVTHTLLPTPLSTLSSQTVAPTSLLASHPFRLVQYSSGSPFSRSADRCVRHLALLLAERSRPRFACRG